MKEKPNYYAIIPARVRYAKDLSMFQKLLFGELTALSNKEGFCWAGNAYFAKLYDKTETWISETLNDMYKKGYLHIYRSSTNSQNRKVYIRENLNSCFREKPKVLSRKTESTFREKPKHNNTRVNTKNNKGSLSASPLSYQEVKTTYKTKHAIANRKGINLKAPKRTPRQEKTAGALKMVDYFRDRAQELHGFQFFKVQDESRNKKIRQLIIRANQNADVKSLIDWWLDGAGEWADYEPENCFTTRTIEQFSNKQNKKQKHEPGLHW